MDPINIFLGIVLFLSGTIFGCIISLAFRFVIFAADCDSPRDEHETESIG